MNKMDFCATTIGIYYLNTQTNKIIRLTTAITAAKLLSDSVVVVGFCEPV